MSASIGSTNYHASNFIRTGGSVAFEERAAQPSDFPDYAAEYAKDPEVFLFAYPNWQEYADCYIMRRSVVTISGRQRCATTTFRANDLKAYTETGFTRVKNFAIPGSNSSAIPSGKYLLTSFAFADTGEQYTDLTVTYQQYGKWDLVKLRNPPALKKQD